jgi:Spy/CpxP family protein refolding chaperone
MRKFNVKVTGIALASLLAVTTAAFAAPPAQEQNQSSPMQSGQMMQGKMMNHGNMMSMMQMMGRMNKMMANCNKMMQQMNARMGSQHQPKPEKGQGG